MISPTSYARPAWSPTRNEQPRSRLDRLLDHQRQDSIGIAPADHEPARVGLAALRATAPVPDDHMEVPDRLLRLGDGDTTSPKLVQGGLRSELLIDGVRHPLSMIDAWDGQTSSNNLIRAENGEGGVGGTTLET
jgi:hypothetical protein